MTKRVLIKNNLYPTLDPTSFYVGQNVDFFTVNWLNFWFNCFNIVALNIFIFIYFHYSHTHKIIINLKVFSPHTGNSNAYNKLVTITFAMCLRHFNKTKGWLFLNFFLIKTIFFLKTVFPVYLQKLENGIPSFP